MEPLDASDISSRYAALPTPLYRMYQVFGFMPLGSQAFVLQRLDNDDDNEEQDSKWSWGDTLRNSWRYSLCVLAFCLVAFRVARNMAGRKGHNAAHDAAWVLVQGQVLVAYMVFWYFHRRRLIHRVFGTLPDLPEVLHVTDPTISEEEFRAELRDDVRSLITKWVVVSSALGLFLFVTYNAARVAAIVDDTCGESCENFMDDWMYTTFGRGFILLLILSDPFLNWPPFVFIFLFLLLTFVLLSMNLEPLSDTLTGLAQQQNHPWMPDAAEKLLQAPPRFASEPELVKGVGSERDNNSGDSTVGVGVVTAYRAHSVDSVAEEPEWDRKHSKAYYETEADSIELTSVPQRTSVDPPDRRPSNLSRLETREVERHESKIGGGWQRQKTLVQHLQVHFAGSERGASISGKGVRSLLVGHHVATLLELVQEARRLALVSVILLVVFSVTALGFHSINYINSSGVTPNESSFLPPMFSVLFLILSIVPAPKVYRELHVLRHRAKTMHKNMLAATTAQAHTRAVPAPSQGNDSTGADHTPVGDNDEPPKSLPRHVSWGGVMHDDDEDSHVSGQPKHEFDSPAAEHELPGKSNLRSAAPEDSDEDDPVALARPVSHVSLNRHVSIIDNFHITDMPKHEVAKHNSLTGAVCWVYTYMLWDCLKVLLFIVSVTIVYAGLAHPRCARFVDTENLGPASETFVDCRLWRKWVALSVRAGALSVVTTLFPFVAFWRISGWWLSWKMVAPWWAFQALISALSLAFLDASLLFPLALGSLITTFAVGYMGQSRLNGPHARGFACWFLSCFGVYLLAVLLCMFAVAVPVFLRISEDSSKIMVFIVAVPVATVVCLWVGYRLRNALPGRHVGEGSVIYPFLLLSVAQFFIFVFARVFLVTVKKLSTQIFGVVALAIAEVSINAGGPVKRYALWYLATCNHSRAMEKAEIWRTDGFYIRLAHARMYVDILSIAFVTVFAAVAQYMYSIGMKWQVLTVCWRYGADKNNNKNALMLIADGIDVGQLFLSFIVQVVGQACADVPTLMIDEGIHDRDVVSLFMVHRKFYFITFLSVFPLLCILSTRQIVLALTSVQ